MTTTETRGTLQRVLMMTVFAPVTRNRVLWAVPTITPADLDNLAALWHSPSPRDAWEHATELVAVWTDQGRPRRRTFGELA